MRIESKKFLEQAKMDFEAGIKNMENKIFFVSAFLFQQAAEKSLKAFWIEKNKENPPSTHNLIILAESLNLPEDLIECSKVLTPHSVISRYPTGEFAPYEIYSEAEVLRLKECSERILKWIEVQLK
ncbi:HEPN domain-containing protein [Nanoarchaeota archaeon NZ13-N]|nr:MAG: HEPN domain-containing protein [Nanoarchaeota archaeon NZ13-N]